MPRIEQREIKSAYTVPKYVAWVFWTESETETIAKAASTTAAIIHVFQALSVPHLAMLRTMSRLVAWKARQCRKHGKCLMITITAGLPLLGEYHPSEIDEYLRPDRMP